MTAAVPPTTYNTFFVFVIFSYSNQGCLLVLNAKLVVRCEKYVWKNNKKSQKLTICDISKFLVVSSKFVIVSSKFVAYFPRWSFAMRFSPFHIISVKNSIAVLFLIARFPVPPCAGYFFPKNSAKIF